MTEQTATRSAAVAGAGGNLGSQLTGHLARMTAFARILVIDPDRYEPKNLAGQDIAALVGTAVSLRCHVKVTPKWRDNRRFLKDMGLAR